MHLDMLDMWKMADGEVRRQLVNIVSKEISQHLHFPL
jgi:hypothetical protein